MKKKYKFNFQINSPEENVYTKYFIISRYKLENNIMQQLANRLSVINPRYVNLQVPVTTKCAKVISDYLKNKFSIKHLGPYL